MLTNTLRGGQVPKNITTWEWLFESKEYSPLYTTNTVDGSRKPRLGGYVNAITKERLDWAQVKTKATRLCTILQRKYDLRPGDTVSLFSTNTIWYPVAMWAVVRAGTFLRISRRFPIVPPNPPSIAMAR